MVSCFRPIHGAVTLALTALGLSAFGGEAEPATEVVGIERGIARVVCTRREDGERFRARAFVVEPGPESHDVDLVVTPAHVLREASHVLEDCVIVTDNGFSTAIARLRMPEPAAGLGSDWAVLVPAKRLEGKIGRLRVAALEPGALERLSSERAPLRLMLYSQSVEQHDCTFADDRLSVPGVFAHSCRTWAGTSGAPITIDVDGTPVVVAMNIARRLDLSRDSSRHFVGIGLAIDGRLAAALREAALQ